MKIPAKIMFVVACIAYAVLFYSGHTTLGVVVVLLMGMSYIAGMLAKVNPKPFQLEDDELEQIINGLDETGGLLVKPSELRHVIEEQVNRERGTTIEWTAQELRKWKEQKLKEGST